MKNSQHRHILMIDVNYPNYETELGVLSDYNIELHEIKGEQVYSKENEYILEQTEAVLVREFAITEKVIRKIKNCKIIVRYGVGIDNIDLKAATAKKIYVANVQDYGTNEVSDHSIALLLSVSRRIVSRNNDVKKGGWNIGVREPIYSFSGKTLGIIGFGRIGREFYKKAAPLGFSNILVYDPYTKNYCNDIHLTNLKELCKKSDVISLHAPLTKNTHHLINETNLELMKENIIIINTSRGGLIDEIALERYLINGKIFGVGLDVFEEEPPGKQHRLFQYDNVIVTDHNGWYSEEALHSLKEKAALNVFKVFSGEKPQFWVNRWEE